MRNRFPPMNGTQALWLSGFHWPSTADAAAFRKNAKLVRHRDGQAQEFCRGMENK